MDIRNFRNRHSQKRTQILHTFFYIPLTMLESYYSTLLATLEVGYHPSILKMQTIRNLQDIKNFRNRRAIHGITKAYTDPTYFLLHSIDNAWMVFLYTLRYNRGWPSSICIKSADGYQKFQKSSFTKTRVHRFYILSSTFHRQCLNRIFTVHFSRHQRLAIIYLY